VVVDDADMRITDVIRGDDHLNNTPRQMNIYDALGKPMPRFAHLPMILGPDGAKLSKRHGAVNVLGYREDGFLPHALLNYLVRLGWSHGDQERNWPLRGWMCVRGRRPRQSSWPIGSAPRPSAISRPARATCTRNRQTSTRQQSASI
jgi:hypothetical protein